jgi:hypothetical protein
VELRRSTGGVTTEAREETMGFAVRRRPTAVVAPLFADVASRIQPGIAV